MQGTNSSASSHRIDIVKKDNSDYNDMIFAQDVYHYKMNIVIINIVIMKVVCMTM